MLKKLTALLLCAVMLLGLVPAMGLQADAAETVIYNFDGGTLYFRPDTGMITGYKGTGSALNIPEKIEGTSVTGISQSAFSNVSNLVSVTVPNSVTVIESNSFRNCSGLTTVILSENITEIPEGLFYQCKNLVSVAIPDGVTKIGDRAFYYCSSLADLVIPNSVTYIDKFAFYECDALTSVKIPDTVTYLGANAFYHCDLLKSVILGKGIPEIQAHTFSQCPKLETLYMYDTVKTIKDLAFYNSENLHTIYYEGSVAMWKKINISYLGNDELYGAKVFCTDGLVVIMDNPFTDVKEKDYFYDPVLWALADGITTGTSATTFGPEKPCTRGQVVTFLWRAKGSPEPTSTTNPFSDVKEKDYYYKAVLWAVENGITTGTGGGKFSPNNACTRGQVVTFLWRAQLKPSPASSQNTFKDVSSNAYYYDAVLWAVGKGVTSGTGNGKFSPDNPCTRGQIVTFLYRAMT